MAATRAVVRARSRPGARRGEVSRVRVAEMQRSRLLAATARMVDELGYAGATVSHITLRARVSRRTFYELFANREECFAAVLEDAAQRIAVEIEGSGLGEGSWRERVRGGLWAILSFLDREPVLARVCVVQALRGSRGVLERREEILRGLARALDAGRLEGARGGECPSLTAEGLVGGAFGIVYARLLHGEREPLTGLLGELMGMIVLPYLGPAVARRERALPVPEASVRGLAVRDGIGVEHDPLDGLPMRLTYRTWRVLAAIGERAGASNREVAAAAGVVDQGQISKLLARLERLGLIHNTTTMGRGGNGHRPSGEPNAWCLTTRGGEVERVTTRVQTNHTHARSGDSGGGER
jgi:AcrR family transcriptional regulator